MFTKFSSVREFNTKLSLLLEPELCHPDWEIQEVMVVKGKGRTRSLKWDNVVTCRCCDHVWWNAFWDAINAFRKYPPESGWIGDMLGEEKEGVIPRTLIILIDGPSA